MDLQTPGCYFFFKLSDLKSNFILTLGYLNPALNNPALDVNACRFVGSGNMEARIVES